MNVKLLVSVAFIGVSVAILIILLQDETNPTAAETLSPTSELKLMETNGVKHLVPLDKIKGGGPPKDGIPSVDDPVFASISESQFMSDSDTVIGLEINGDARAYPLFILVWHEIVNDTVGEIPVSVTYCPLCYTNQVFERIVDGEEVEFGTSGKLYNSNLLMYDRLTESYWSQALGLAVKGELTGTQLNLVPFDVITWGDWKELYPNTLVMTTDTGYLRSYATDPYGNYYTEPRIMFPVEYRDERIHPKEIIIGIEIDNVYKAYRQNDIESENVINDFVNNEPLLLVSLFSENSRVFERTVNDKVLDFQLHENKMIDLQTNSEWNYDGVAISGPYLGTQLERIPTYPGFWFEWFAFHPNTLVYGDF